MLSFFLFCSRLIMLCMPLPNLHLYYANNAPSIFALFLLQCTWPVPLIFYFNYFSLVVASPLCTVFRTFGQLTGALLETEFPLGYIKNRECVCAQMQARQHQFIRIVVIFEDIFKTSLKKNTYNNSPSIKILNIHSWTHLRIAWKCFLKSVM